MGWEEARVKEVVGADVDVLDAHGEEMACWISPHSHINTTVSDPTCHLETPGTWPRTSEVSSRP